jgi:hypothetical protein
MTRDSVMNTGLPKAGTQLEPGIESSRDQGANSLAMRDAAYRALQAAVDAFEVADAAGVARGAQALSDAMGAARSDVYLRVMRKEDSKGAMQRAFFDYLGPLLALPKSRRAFVERLLAELDYEPPVPRRRATAEDIGKAWLAQLNALPPGEREGRRADMAAALGVRAEDLR